MKYAAYTVVFVGALMSASAVAFADTATVPVAPESAPLPSTPGEAIQNLYTYLLFVSGFLAVGAIVWGTIVYVSAAGNPGKQKDGKEWIEEALKGLLLLFAAALLLRTVNPELLNLNLLEFAGLKNRETLCKNTTRIPICEFVTTDPAPCEPSYKRPECEKSNNTINLPNGVTCRYTNKRPVGEEIKCNDTQPQP